MPSTYDTPFIDFIPESESVTFILIVPSLYTIVAVGAAATAGAEPSAARGSS